MEEHRIGSMERWKIALITILSLLAGVMCAALLAGPLIQRLPHDLMRTETILSALGDARRKPDGVIFGNSVAMNGVDGRIIGEALSGDAEFYNLSSTGQTLPESYLYYQEIPESVETIVQVVTPLKLEEEEHIHESVYNTFYLYGYRPEAETVEVLSEIMGEPEATLFRRSMLWHRLQSRWVLRQWIDTSVRGLIRTDLELGRGVHDLYYPAPYETRLPEEKIDRILERAKTPRNWEGLKIPEKNLRIMKAMVRKSDELGVRDFYFLFAPLHPELQEHYGDRYLEEIRRFIRELDLGPNVHAIDMVSLLGEKEYIDHAHPTAAGARKISELLAAEMRKHR